jgi:CRISPR-associated endonuclease/helicase Cas3
MDDYLSSAFRTLTNRGSDGGYEPLHWQRRLFERFCENDIPSYCDLPTGLGKTSVLHLWLIARLWQLQAGQPARLPRRLVYVVDRRTVVDQATVVAEQIRKNLERLNSSETGLTVSTLRGKFADNRDWAVDPSKPAIIIGTVDMIGSRLLFSGYRSSYKQRPLEAGLLGQDTLLVLDEAHLSTPFEKLVRALGDGGRFQKNQGLPMKVMCMSATTTNDDPTRFKLEKTDLEGDPDNNPVLRRYEAKKRLALVPPVEKSKIRHEIVNVAAELVEKDNSRVVVFTQKPEEATEIAKALRKRLSLGAVEVLTGTMRGLERDELLEQENMPMRRFLDGQEKPEDRAGKVRAVLVSTSAGEVGFDLNADHMICDAAPFDSIIQRLGRVNRRGHGDATILVYVTKADDKQVKGKGRKSAGKNTWEAATAETLKCLEQLPLSADGTRDASPRAIDQLKQSLPQEQIQAALTPKPDTVELTDILLDAWSMTTIAGRMPGRPPVAPWLRGLDDGEPQTTIAWRSELDVQGFGLLDLTDIEDWFDAHRVMPHETLSVPTSKAREWMLDRWEQLSEQDRLTAADKPCVVDRGGLQLFTVKELVNELSRKVSNFPIVNSDIVVPASFGGIQRKQGLLDAKAPAPGESAEGTMEGSLSISDVADTERGRYRLLREDAFGSNSPLVGAPPENYANLARFVIDLPAQGDNVRQLISLVPKKERTEYGTSRQSLQTHVSLVEKYAGEITGRLSLSNSVFCEGVRLAATWHDNGKDREVWQRAVGRTLGEEPVGKSGGFMRRIAGDYRHEFGSLRELAEAYQGKIGDHAFDLAMHLIAVHHGRGRPHFPKGGFDPDTRAESPRIALDSVRRFARLQRRYGYWQLAWLENLLRCADAMASAEKDVQP